MEEAKFALDIPGTHQAVKHRELEDVDGGIRLDGDDLLLHPSVGPLHPPLGLQHLAQSLPAVDVEHRGEEASFVSQHHLQAELQPDFVNLGDVLLWSRCRGYNR